MFSFKGRKKGHFKYTQLKMAILQKITDTNSFSSTRSIMSAFELETGTKVNVCRKTMTSYLKTLKFRRNKGNFTHPNKFNTPEKLQYFNNFFLFQQTTSFSEHWNYCFQDESHIEKNGQFMIFFFLFLSSHQIQIL